LPWFQNKIAHGISGSPDPNFGYSFLFELSSYCKIVNKRISLSEKFPQTSNISKSSAEKVLDKISIFSIIARNLKKKSDALVGRV
jgi:hypothetical protein